MSAAMFELLADPEKAVAISAGTNPGTKVHPEVVIAMQELGLDLSDRQPRKLTDDLAKGASLLVTMGCGEACPHVPGLQHLDWPLTDPKGKSVEEVREIRDQVKALVTKLVEEKGWGRNS
jgi:arsenate reductase